MLPQLLCGYALTLILGKYTFKLKRYLRWRIIETVVYVLLLLGGIWYTLAHSTWMSYFPSLFHFSWYNKREVRL